MKRSLDTAAHCTTLDRGRHEPVEAARAQLGVTALAFVAAGNDRCTARAPRAERVARGRGVHAPPGRQPRIAVSLGEDGLIVPVVHRAHELSVEGPRGPRSVSRGAPAPASCRRGRPRRHVHDHEPWPVRLDHGDADHQPAAGRDPRPRGGDEARRWSSTDSEGNDSIAIRPTTILGLSWDHRALDGAQSASSWRASNATSRSGPADEPVDRRGSCGSAASARSTTAARWPFRTA